MTTRYHALTVLLEEPIREDDAEGLIEAIRRLRGVMDVQPLIADVNLHWAEEKARRELGKQLWAVLYPERA